MKRGMKRGWHSLIHGHSRGGNDGKGSPEYKVWMSMIQRCTNPKRNNYHLYGGRGITVCERWRSGFAPFLADMGLRAPGMTLDRINNDGNYEPGNCRWATRKEQAANSRHTRWVEFNGERRSMVEWARLAGISYFTLRQRLDAGMPAERALSRRNQQTGKPIKEKTNVYKRTG